MGKSIVATWQEQDHAHEAASIDTAINFLSHGKFTQHTYPNLAHTRGDILAGLAKYVAG
jgi:hypothetical protein